jgi:DNA (cytosine-5)-methyltransferase 1
VRLTVGSLFSGVGGFDLGFEQAGCDVRWQIEINGQCVKVLSQRWPGVRRFADVNALVYGRAKNRAKHGLVLERVDILCGGFPCQDLSIAGKRKGLAGARSGLFFAFMRAVRLVKPQWVVIENVPGLLTSHGGRDFHTVLTTLAECGMRRSYRILDSQYFGLAQRRDRVFIVGHSRAFRDDTREILFEPAGRQGDSQARSATGTSVAATLRGRSAGRGVNMPGRGGEDDVNLIPFDTTQITSKTNRSRPQAGAPCHALSASAHAPAIAGPLGGGNDGIGRRSEDDPNLVLVAATLNSGGNSGGFRTELGEHLVVSRERARALTSSMWRHHDEDTDTLIPIANTLNANSGRRQIEETLVASPLLASAGHHGHSSPRGDGRDNLVAQSGVRRLTPLECERLQGFPDGWTCLCGRGHLGTRFCSCTDSARYKQLGNAVSVPVAKWIAERIVKSGLITSGE